MRYLLTAIVFALTATVGVAEDGAPVPSPDPISNLDIQWPARPIITQPDDPAPSPQVNPTIPSPSEVTDIRAGEMYVLEWPGTEFFAFGSPAGLVSVLKVNGPVTLFSKFSDGVDRSVEELRTYNAPVVYVFRALKAGPVEVIAVPAGATDAGQMKRKTLTVMGLGPQPPPDGPVVVPDDPVVVPDDPDVPVGKIQVVIIEDPQQRNNIPASQLASMDSRLVRDYARSHCQVTEGTPDFRVLSLRQDVSNQPSWIQEAFKVQRTALPSIVILSGSKIISGPLPNTVEETLTLLQKYGGQ